jgi:DNA-binding response OmpR family regulator
MSDIAETVREAFEAAGYEVAGVNRNRDRVRVELLDDRADAAALREVTTDAVGDGVVGLDVSTESMDGADGVRTVVSFRHVG